MLLPNVIQMVNIHLYIFIQIEVSVSRGQALLRNPCQNPQIIPPSLTLALFRYHIWGTASRISRYCCVVDVPKVLEEKVVGEIWGNRDEKILHISNRKNKRTFKKNSTSVYFWCYHPQTGRKQIKMHYYTEEDYYVYIIAPPTDVRGGFVYPWI